MSLGLNINIKAGWPPLATLLVTFFAGSFPMMDAVMLAIAFAFFALSIAYVYVCDML